MYALTGHEEKQCGTSVASLAKNSLRDCEWEVKMEDGSSMINEVRSWKIVRMMNAYEYADSISIYSLPSGSHTLRYH